MRNLIEGMRGGDLEDLVLPLVSVDEYESKIDDDAIVVAFFVSEHGAAEDLNRYLQRSPVELLDTEISPAPDAQGFFMVFVELLRNKTFADNVTALLEEVAPLVNIENWKIQARGHDDLIPFDKAALQKIANPEEESLAESLREFFFESDLTDLILEEGRLTLVGGHERRSFDIVGFGDPEQIMRDQGLTEAAVSMKLSVVAECQRLSTMLGYGWSVTRIGNTDIVQFSDKHSALFVRR